MPPTWLPHRLPKISTSTTRRMTGPTPTSRRLRIHSQVSQLVRPQMLSMLDKLMPTNTTPWVSSSIISTTRRMCPTMSKIRSWKRSHLGTWGWTVLPSQASILLASSTSTCPSSKTRIRSESQSLDLTSRSTLRRLSKLHMGSRRRLSFSSTPNAVR
ncbi:hypothetical protein K491DRAFT_247050 [Lophiostoma macrostomum CBS 122681]|uniref:Uncharacterized protein n=1 Tax=Lophiostoma macrostomum CBS 122681 TaxID=1314788 RepID=A0A6A6TIN9_9PLEO|nr:hypothetical protein K491DRAFT_247050 [Lophiostoma macrostomum CBS 122681]